jgi:hypothetical protein
MPPKPSRSTQSGSSNLPAPVVDPNNPALSPAQASQSLRSNESLTPAPETPVQRASDRATAEPDELRLPEPRVATAAEVTRLNEIIARLEQRLDRLEPVPSAQEEREERHATFEREPSYREASYTPTTATTYPHRPKIKASDLPKFYGKDNEDVDQWIEKVSAIFET